ncbi:hypothetical protein C8F04DRAFT_1084484 [Mycena alexandri]|uniref:Uncharacterized protein n=1 Tax=Mycena alexandri TaxID=1745969 RepID=A0AAD6X7Z2_9AGAR|nr:hypothetical protein C8F04DRAFT_1084484 [Mycena alexandri]
MEEGREWKRSSSVGKSAVETSTTSALRIHIAISAYRRGSSQGCFDNLSMRTLRSHQLDTDDRGERTRQTCTDARCAPLSPPQTTPAPSLTNTEQARRVCVSSRRLRPSELADAAHTTQLGVRILALDGRLQSARTTANVRCAKRKSRVHPQQDPVCALPADSTPASRCTSTSSSPSAVQSPHLVLRQLAPQGLARAPRPMVSTQTTTANTVSSTCPGKIGEREWRAIGRRYDFGRRRTLR